MPCVSCWYLPCLTAGTTHRVGQGSTADMDVVDMVVVLTLPSFFCLCSQKERKHIKYVHAAILTFASAFAFLGLYPVIKTRGFQLSVFHHWIGYLALLLMLQNYVLGILKFVFKFQIFESCLGHVKKGAGVVQTYIPTHRNLGLATIVAIYVAAISGVYKLANCGSVGGCGGGTSLLLLLVIGLFMVMGALHPQFLYPDNLCEPCLDKVAAWCKACCEPHQERRHNSDDGDAADNLLPASRGGYGSSDRNGGACAGGSGDDLSTSGSSYDSDGHGHRLLSEGGYHQTSVTQRNPVNTSYNGAQLPIGGMMTFPDAGSGAAATGAGAGAGNGNVGGKKKKSSRKHAAKKADNTRLARENVDDERYGAV